MYKCPLTVSAKLVCKSICTLPSPLLHKFTSYHVALKSKDVMKTIFSSSINTPYQRWTSSVSVLLSEVCFPWAGDAVLCVLIGRIEPCSVSSSWEAQSAERPNERQSVCAEPEISDPHPNTITGPAGEPFTWAKPHISPSLITWLPAHTSTLTLHKHTRRRKAFAKHPFFWAKTKEQCPVCMQVLK